MRLPHLRAALPWLVCLSLLASLGCFIVAVWLGATAGSDVTQRAALRLVAQADGLARHIDADMAEYDLVLRDVARLAPGADAMTATPKTPLLDLPLTANYIGFINVLNEVGDVVADPRSNVSRPVNFAGRDYFQDHQKNPADKIMIGRPFATTQHHPSIPISRRLNRPDGTFAGVVVAGVRLTWLGDLLALPSPDPKPVVTIRREDGLILMHAPFDADAIGRAGTADPAWENYLRTGLSEKTTEATGIHLFRRVGTTAMVLELVLDRAAIEEGRRSWLIWLPLLALVPGLCILGLSFAGWRLLRRGIQAEADATITSDECMRMLANMSHELRTPLTAILGHAELLKEEDGLSERQASRLARLTEAGTLMRKIVDRVINIARPDDIAAAPIPVPCDLDSLVHTCLAMVEHEARRKGVLLTSNVSPSAPRQPMLDRDRVQQMVVNLLMNAVKYTARGSVALRVSGDATLLRIEIADTGPGIPPEQRWRLFRAYDRIDANVSRAEGSGLGLSITQRLALRMGGQVGYAENPGGGSVFWIEVPLSGITAIQTDGAQPIDTQPDASVTEMADDLSPASADRRHLRVLLADDLDLTRSVTADFLRNAGHHVTEVPDGETAVAAVRDDDFDVVLTDMRMPVVDGLEVTRRIRVLPGHRGRTPVVLVTADLVALAEGASGVSGVDACVRKPFTRAELLTAVLTAARLTLVSESGEPPGGTWPLRAQAADVPDRGVATFGDEVLNTAALADLKRTVGDAAFDRHLNIAARRIADLLSLLERPDAGEKPPSRDDGQDPVGDAVHDLIGVAGLLGLTALSVNLRWFDVAPVRAGPAAALREAAAATLAALSRHQEPVATE